MHGQIIVAKKKESLVAKGKSCLLRGLVFSLRQMLQKNMNITKTMNMFFEAVFEIIYSGKMITCYA